MERGSGAGAGDVTANDTSYPSHGHGGNMKNFPHEICLRLFLEMFQHKRGPYLCVLSVGKSLTCLPAVEKIPGMQCSHCP